MSALVERLDRKIRSPAAWMTSDLRAFYTELRDTLSAQQAEIERLRGLLKDGRVCALPPTGWWCSRAAGHEGPCAARPVNPAQQICDQLHSRFADEPDFLGMEAASLIQEFGAAIQRVHRHALAAQGAGYDLILSVTDPLVNGWPTVAGEAALNEGAQDD